MSSFTRSPILAPRPMPSWWQVSSDIAKGTQGRAEMIDLIEVQNAKSARKPERAFECSKGASGPVSTSDR